MSNLADINTRFHTLEPDTQKMILRVGMEMYEHGCRALKSEITSSAHEASQEQNTKLRELQSQYTETVSGYQSEIAKLKDAQDGRIHQLEAEKRQLGIQLREELDVVREHASERERELRERFREDVGEQASQLANNREAILQEELRITRENAEEEKQRLRQENKEALGRLTETEARLYERAKENEERWRRELDAMLQSHVEEKRSQTQEYTKEITKLQDVVHRLVGTAENSSKRGRLGETIAGEEIRRVCSDGAEITDMAKEGGCGDFHIVFENLGKIVIDIKHHEKGSGGVRKKDRDKLLRDIDDDKNGAIGGILVATQATIQGMTPGSILRSPVHNRPMVACELRGDWDRLVDAVNVIRCATEMANENTAGETSAEELKETLANVETSYDETIAGLKKVRDNIYQEYVALNGLIGTQLYWKGMALGKPTDVRQIGDWVLEKSYKNKGTVNFKTVCEEYSEDTAKLSKKVQKKKLTKPQAQNLRDCFVRCGMKLT